MKFIKRPVVIDAVQWNGDNRDEVFDGLGLQDMPLKSVYESALGDLLYIRTAEGVMRAQRNDWIIKGVEGELYPCKPDIFAMTYAAINGSDEKCQNSQLI